MDVFSKRAQMLLALARRAADRLNHDYVGTEHLLLGLLQLNDSTAATILTRLRIEPGMIRAELERRVGARSGPRITGNIPYTDQVKKVLALANRQTRAANHPYVGTEHILLGILSDGEGTAAQLLKSYGAELETAHMVMLSEFAQKPEYPVEGATDGTPLEKGPPQQTPDSTATSADKPSLRPLSRLMKTLKGWLIGSHPAVSHSLLPFTPESQQALAIARREAERLRHAFISTEHLLLALTSLGDGVATLAFARLGINLEDLRVKTENTVGSGPDTGVRETPSYTPRVKRALALAAKEAHRSRHKSLGSGHLLLGLIVEQDGVAAHILKEQGVDPRRTRALVRELAAVETCD